MLASNRGALPETISYAGFLFDIPAKYTAGEPRVPSAEEVEPWVQTIIRLWDDAAQYEGCSRAVQGASDGAPTGYGDLPRVLRRHHPSARRSTRRGDWPARRVARGGADLSPGASKRAEQHRRVHRLGVIRHQQGDQEAAIELIGRAIALDPQNALYRNDYGLPLVSLRASGRPSTLSAPLKSTRSMRRPWPTWGRC